MSVNGSTEQDAIELRLSSYLLDGNVYTSLPEELQLPRYADTGLVMPYIILTFGSPFAAAADRSIEGAAQQPQVMPVMVECWASNDKAARRTAGAVFERLLGWKPSEDNASELESSGGGLFQTRDASGRPTRFMQSVNFVTTINMSILAP